MNDLFTDYLNGVMARCEKAMPDYHPECPGCSLPITGNSYNGFCYTCYQDQRRQDYANWKQQEGQ